MALLDYASGNIEDPGGMRDRYLSASPFPHIVIDDFLDPDLVRRAITEFPVVDGPHWTNYLHVNERKFGNTKPDTWGPALQEIAERLTSPEFVHFIEDLTGIDDLHPDPLFDGAGLHRSVTGGYLNIHADFTAHHTEPGWERRVNLILFLNDEWRDEWGGDLELWSRDMKRCEQSISPVGNRAVIFTTTTDSFHGHPSPLTCPEGVARKSMALYYFTAGSAAKARTTDYRSRPGDGLRSIAIYLDKRALRAYDVVKRRFGISDATVSKWLARLRRRPRE